MRKVMYGLMAVVLSLMVASFYMTATAVPEGMVAMGPPPDGRQIPWVPTYVAAERRADALQAALEKSPVPPVPRVEPLAVIEPGYTEDVEVVFPACSFSDGRFWCPIWLEGVRLGPNVGTLRVHVVFDDGKMHEVGHELFAPIPAYREPFNLRLVYLNEEWRQEQKVKVRFQIGTWRNLPSLDVASTSTVDGIKVATTSSSF